MGDERLGQPREEQASAAAGEPSTSVFSLRPPSTLFCLTGPGFSQDRSPFSVALTDSSSRT